MFAPYCVAHGSRVLLSMSSITELESTGDRIVAHFTCFCGQEGTWTSAR